MAVALVPALLVGGCAGASDSSAPPGSPIETESPEGGAGPPGSQARVEDPKLSTPLQFYMLTWRELATVGTARDLLVRDCMGQFGFDYPVTPYAEQVEASRAAEQEGNAHVFGVTDLASAQLHGYYPASVGTDADAEAAEDPESSQAYNFVLFGTKDLGRPAFGQTESPGELDGQPIPGGGCTSEADRQLGTDDPDISVYGVARELWIQNVETLYGSVEYQDAVAEWSACVAQEGYRVTDPVRDRGDIKRLLDQRADGVGAGGQSGPSGPEIALAVTDIGCKEETDFIDTVEAAANRLDQQTIDEHQLRLDGDRERLDGIVKRATELVDGVVS